jgi:acetoin:2,6-dichlorophenolindophenol oxidoreductase subunit alpha
VNKKYSKDFYAALYRRMVVIRYFDLRAVLLRQQGFIPGFIHPSEGQEATAVGACAALESSDVIVSNHRGHGHHIAKGGNPETMMAELMGKETGDCKGRGGSLHIADYELGNIGANGIVGGGIPIAVGAALSFSMRNEPRVALAFFGDGASNQGAFHEAANMASVWKLPAVFFCENNHYGEGTVQDRHMAIERISRRAEAYGIRGIHVDGNDVIAVYEAVREAAEHARSGNGPDLIEAETDRLCGAYEGDPQYYRTKEEVEGCRERDPISLFRERLIDEGVLTGKEFDELDADVKKEIDAAVDFAKKSPQPEKETMYQYVYGNDEDGRIFGSEWKK